MLCDSKEERDDWIKSIQESAFKASFNTTLKKKIQKLTKELTEFDYLYFTTR